MPENTFVGRTYSPDALCFPFQSAITAQLESDPGFIYPYLLKGLKIDKPNQVWCADITYIPVEGGLFYLVAIMDWYSRYVPAWELSNSLEALTWALNKNRPEIFNTAQGSQFTSKRFASALEEKQIKVSHDGKGRFMDNIFTERLWRSLKHEEFYLYCYGDG